MPDDGSPDVFCHVTAIAESNFVLGEGDTVSFETVDDRRGRKAVDVQILD